MSKKMQDTGCRIQDAGYRIPDNGLYSIIKGCCKFQAMPNILYPVS
jgi:hypothetical protein